MLSGSKILVYRGGSWDEYDIPSKLTFCYPSDFIIIDNIVIETDGDAWIGCRCRLLHFDGTTWMAYSNENGIAEGSITDITLDRLGKLWVATDQGHISTFDGKQWTTYSENDATKLGSIYSILALPDGTLWFGGFKGVSHFDGKIWNTYEHKGKNWFIVADVMASSDSNSVWTFGDAGGSYYFDTNDWTPIDNLDGAIFTSALAISDNNVGVGTLKGLFHFSGKKWIKISDLHIKSIAQDHDGRIWIGTRKGLFMVNK